MTRIRISFGIDMMCEEEEREPLTGVGTGLVEGKECIAGVMRRSRCRLRLK